MLKDTIKEKIMNIYFKSPKVLTEYPLGKVSVCLMDNNMILFKLDNKPLNWFFSSCHTSIGDIDTRKATFKEFKFSILEEVYHLELVYAQDNLQLVQHIYAACEDPYFTIKVEVSSNETFSTNQIKVMDFPYPPSDANELFLSLSQRMLLIPYDNDMWVSYEAAPLKPGRKSYDVTCIYSEETNEGLLIGALDFDTWKNAIVCSSYDARSYYAVSGIADENTHDTLPHGYLTGKSISSSSFVCGWFDNYRDGLKLYGKLASNPDRMVWNHGVPFGWNSYSALTLDTHERHIMKAGQFLKENVPNFVSEENVTYINYDAVFGISKRSFKESIKYLHDNGQKVGTYLMPLAYLPLASKLPLIDPFKNRESFILKCPDGSDYNPVDGKLPIDITIPEAEASLREQLRDIVEMGYDYLKIDFLSHGALEGVRFNKEIVTGRQALMYFYNILKEELDPKKINRDIFVSLSIAPLFPCGYGHARRCCCDSFGHHEDVKYVLNALTYSFWTNGNLYQYNDPDHTVLHQSRVDGRPITSLAEARSRYNASVISGTVMLLSDNLGPSKEKGFNKEAHERVIAIANNKELNKLAQIGKAFEPLEMNQTANIFYLEHEDHLYVAIFNLEGSEQTIEVNPSKFSKKPCQKLKGISTDFQSSFAERFKIKLPAYDSLIVELL